MKKTTNMVLAIHDNVKADGAHSIPKLWSSVPSASLSAMDQQYNSVYQEESTMSSKGREGVPTKSR